MKLNDFIAAMPDGLPVILDFEWDYYKAYARNIKKYQYENRHMIVESYRFSNDIVSWYAANDITESPLTDPVPDPTGEYMIISIYDGSKA